MSNENITVLGVFSCVEFFSVPRTDCETSFQQRRYLSEDLSKHVAGKANLKGKEFQ